MLYLLRYTRGMRHSVPDVIEIARLVIAQRVYSRATYLIRLKMLILLRNYDCGFFFYLILLLLFPCWLKYSPYFYHEPCESHGLPGLFSIAIIAVTLTNLLPIRNLMEVKWVGPIIWPDKLLRSVSLHCFVIS